ncbi:MAG: GAF domain-containing protein [Anaerolineales bacterium]|uniref:GAF domain-containing protein n=1 Tax=Candidatus Desulfolinea nitratireducens TaxID=2841698 RepID=A0A8J6NP86_9CHLR|nr:GAF domain-containing protein [Candidatus Desulfolinea nitratireducens]MBL6959764.1 GAF domain-containing protein [Anaerolineales bacterium]
MLKGLVRWFSPPIFEDEEKTRLAGILNYLLLIVIFLLALLLLSRTIASTVNLNTLVTLGTLIIILISSWLMLKRGNVNSISVAVILFGWFAVFNLARGEGIRDTGIIAYFIVILIASVLLGWKASILVTIASVASVWYFAYLEGSGLFIPVYSSASENAIDITFILIISAALLFILDNGLRNAAKRAQANERRMEISNKELQILQVNLEQRVHERTLDLESSSTQIQKRASQLEAIADVASSVASLQEMDKLLPHITRTVSERFGYYHIGIFLLSENKQYAVLRASNSGGGQAMLARDHQLRVGQEGIVGSAVDLKTARIALDVGNDATYFDNPDLPNTHSEMALPLMIGNEVIGVLDVQSEETNAFSGEDIEGLSTLANQVAVAIENARLFQQSQDTLQELDTTFQRYLKNEWSRFGNLSDIIGYRARTTGLEAINEPLQMDGKTINNDSVYKLPVKLRNIVIGYLNVDLDKPVAQYTEDELEIIQATVDRFALALDNARLLEDTTRRAGRERLVSEITTKIRSTNDPQVMIQTALDELKEALGASKIELTTEIPNPGKIEDIEES